MEIALSRKQMKLMTAAAFLILLTAAILVAFASGLFSPQATQNTADEPALRALRTVYHPAGGQEAWEAAVCEGMTEQGCEVFRSLYAPVIWQAAQSGAAPQGDPIFVSVAEDLGEDGQVWALTLDGAPLYIHVQRQDGRWYLARILFEEEAKAHYGGQ